MHERITATLDVAHNNIRVMRIGNEDYISLTDLACCANSHDPSGTIRNWMSNKNSFAFYSLWEELNNENFNSAESHRIKIEEVPYNRFTMTPSRWKKIFGAIGIIPGSGKYSSGTFAHPDIALEFASWIDPVFKLYLIKEFERLKKDESYQRKIEWSVRRSLAKTNYRIHTDSIKNNIIPTISEQQKSFVYADEADIINVALFGISAKDWRNNNPNLSGNIRDYADILQLIILSNLEVINANMIDEGIDQSQRIEKLNNIARKEYELLSKNVNKKDMNNLLKGKEE